MQGAFPGGPKAHLFAVDERQGAQRQRHALQAAVRRHRLRVWVVVWVTGDR